MPCGLLVAARSVYLPKRLIRTLDDHGTIPDGFIVDIPNRQWFIVEVEVAELEKFDGQRKERGKWVLVLVLYRTGNKVEENLRDLQNHYYV